MVTNTSGQPIAGVIGGNTDYLVNVGNVSMNRTTSYENSGVFTSPEQGKDYDMAVVSHTETINPDTSGNTVKKVIPWGLIVVGGFVLYILFRGK